MLNGSCEKVETNHKIAFEHNPETSPNGYAKNDMNGQIKSTEHNIEHTKSAETNGSHNRETSMTVGEILLNATAVIGKIHRNADTETDSIFTQILNSLFDIIDNRSDKTVLTLVFVVKESQHRAFNRS